jgi:photosystem II stability/assembly factor-like uncharacterized protein
MKTTPFYYCIFVLAASLMTGGSGWGQSWTRVNGITDHFNDVAVRPGTDSLLVYTSLGDLFLTVDHGVTWQQLSSNIAGAISVEFAQANSHTDILLVGFTSFPSIQRSTDGGVTWSAAAEVLPDARSCRSLTDQTGRIWIHGHNYLYFSSDGGYHWDSTLVTTQPRTIVWDLWVSPQDSHRLLVAGTAGISGSTDRGQSWSVLYNDSADAVEGNPQNPGSLAAIAGGMLRAKHGNSAWMVISTPISAVIGDVSFLNSDSTQIIFVGEYRSPNLFRSTDGGNSWSSAMGTVIAGRSWRIKPVVLRAPMHLVFWNAGASLYDEMWAHVDRLNIGHAEPGYLISNISPGLIMARCLQGLFLSSDAGTTWNPTPFVSSLGFFSPHAGRDAWYIAVTSSYADQLYLLSYPSLHVDTLALPYDGRIGTIDVSRADTSLIYLTMQDNRLFVSEDGAHTWRESPCPLEPGTEPMISPSSTDPDFALMSSSIFYVESLARVWRTTDRGVSWEMVYQADSTQWASIVDAWSGPDSRTGFFFNLGYSHNMFYYTLDSGETFDSLLTGETGHGYTMHQWGDSIRAFANNGSDSIFISPDFGRSVQFRAHYPEGVPTRLFEGSFSQLVSYEWQNGHSFYYNGLASISSPEPLGNVAATSIQITIFPNPVNGAATLTMTPLVGSDPIRIRIYNILGQEVRTFELQRISTSALRIALPTSGLPSGMYFVQVNSQMMRRVVTAHLVITK